MAVFGRCKMSLETIYYEITVDEDSAYTFLQQHQCIRRTAPNCPLCDRVMAIVKQGNTSKVWRCPSHKGQKLTIRAGSFWENSKLSLAKLLRLAFLWSSKVPHTMCMEFTGLSNPTVTQWYQYFRDACSNYLVQNPIMIGGPNVVVELDESVMAERKHNRGRVIPERWVFGGICLDTQDGFLVFVPNREAATLLPIIQQHVRPGSIIHTDGWASYNGIAGMNVQRPYIHIKPSITG